MARLIPKKTELTKHHFMTNEDVRDTSPDKIHYLKTNNRFDFISICADQSDEGIKAPLNVIDPGVSLESIAFDIGGQIYKFDLSNNPFACLATVNDLDYIKGVFNGTAKLKISSNDEDTAFLYEHLSYSGTIDIRLFGEVNLVTGEVVVMNTTPVLSDFKIPATDKITVDLYKEKITEILNNIEEVGYILKAYEV